MYIVAFLLLFFGCVLKTVGSGSVVSQPPGTCEANIAAVDSTGKSVVLDNGWCSVVTLKVPTTIATEAAELGIGKLVWFASDPTGTLTSFQKADFSNSEPAGSCRAIISSPYQSGTVILKSISSSSTVLSCLAFPRSLSVPDNLVPALSGLAAGDFVWFATASDGTLSLLQAKECAVGWLQASGAVVLAFAVNWMVLLIV